MTHFLFILNCWQFCCLFKAMFSQVSVLFFVFAMFHLIKKCCHRVCNARTGKFYKNILIKDLFIKEIREIVKN